MLENEAGEAYSLVIASAFLKALGCDGKIGTTTETLLPAKPKEARDKRSSHFTTLR